MESLDRPLSTLELTVLGVVLKRGPCVAHAVVNEFSGSNTIAYRSGAGSIYPLLKRMDAAGLVRSEGHSYSITEQGKAALRQWLLFSDPNSDFSTNLDAIRSRVYFLRLLNDEERQEFFKKSLDGLNALLEKCREDVQGYERLGDPFSKLASLGTIRETEARIAWITEIQALMKSTSRTD